ncbi:hypothetical protein POTOM_007513 [Populus tomentosa]|uniref:Uncharacterized protein n=1 Tax=Populus tomentosa TaxID=118781 RepID=A0A8X8AFS2_POPTO|nr:hypothetical protein POTOM_007513 [Populus tomentosa]
MRVTENFSARVTSKLFEKQIREVVSSNFLWFVAISTFPARRQAMADQVNRIADGLAREVEEAMQKDIMETVGNLESFVKTIGKPYQDAAQKDWTNF